MASRTDSQNSSDKPIRSSTKVLPQAKTDKKKKVKLLQSQKFANIDADAYAAIAKERNSLQLGSNEKHVAFSLRALHTKGIWGYLKNMKPEVMRSRVVFGYLRKRTKGAMKYFVSRWWFLISSRPLNMEDFLKDENILSDTLLPPLFEFDTMYSYYMDTDHDGSGSNAQIKTKDIISIEVKDMTTSKKEEGHAFILDTGNTKLHLNALNRFEMERWVEAIVISMQTTRESKLSLTGACRNVSKTVVNFDWNKCRL